MEDLEVVKNEIIETSAKRVSETVMKDLEAKLNAKFVSMEEVQKMFENYKPTAIPSDAKEAEAIELKFWQDVAAGKVAEGSITDTGNAPTMVPTVVANKILDQIHAASYLRNICTVFPDDKGALFVKRPIGGASAYRTAEGTAPSDSTLLYDVVNYNTYEAAASTVVSNKLLAQSTVPILPFIYQQLGLAFADLENTEFITGDGASHEFVGINNSSLTAVTAAATHTSIATLTYDDIVNVWLAVPQQYRSLSDWIISSALEVKLSSIKSSDLKYSDLMDRNAQTILGRPYHINDNLDTEGTTNPIAAFGYFKDYYIFDKGGIAIVTTNQGQTLASQRQTFIIAFANTDGKFVDKTGVRALKLATA